MKKKSPLISIIMNCRNGERFLKNSLKSILNQTYKSWELIFWDNKSTDKSYQILSKIKDKRIKYFLAKKITSLYKARNLAIAKAKGKYICFLDVDDWWAKNKLSTQVNLIKEKKGTNFVYSNFYIYNQSNGRKKIRSKKKLPSGKITQFLLNDYKLGILTVMLKKNYFKNKKFNYRYNIIGDFDYFINLSLTENFYYIKKPLAYYRIHKDNYSKNTSSYSRELNQWLLKNSKKLVAKNYSLKKINYYKNKLKLKNFFNLGP